MINECGDSCVNITLIIPTKNGGPLFKKLIVSLATQTYQPDELLLLDSESADDTVRVAVEAGFSVVAIPRASFDHGGTRQYGVERASGDVVVFMTQDAVLADSDALQRLIQPFSDIRVGAVCGRQLPRAGAGLFEAHARLFNYPAEDRITSRDDIHRLGLRAAFLSDSFAAYRREALLEVRGFSRRTILGEDMLVAAKILQAGWKIVYCANAAVYHSHPYDWRQEFQRYFDTGVMHSREPWLLQEFGGASGAGLKFVRSEMTYLCRQGKAHLLPAALLRTMAKYAGYQLGRHERWVPLGWKKKCSMNKGYWEKEEHS